jgi:predicted TIM-barrel fold metal-dependent hydrolase
MTQDTIDIHPHIISTDTARYPRAPLGGHQSTWSEERPVSYQQLLQDMDEAGVSKAAIVQASTCYGHDNSYVIDAVAAHPDRFTAVCSVDVLAPDANERIEMWMRRGMTGLRLFTTGSTLPGQATWFCDERTFPTWKFAEEIGLPVCMQMTQDGMADLRRIIERFPNIRIVLDHLARPVLDKDAPLLGASELFSLAQHPGVYLKLTVRAFEALEKAGIPGTDFFPLLVEKFGADRIAWGSNHPASAGGLKALRTRAEEGLAMLSSDARDSIFSKTAQAIYPVLAGASSARSAVNA